MFLIILSVPDHCIDYGEQLSFAGGEGEFDGFSCGLQAGAEGFHHGIVARCDEGGQIQRAARVGPPAPDAAFSA